MSDHKTQLALAREQKLAALRGESVQPERIALRVACSQHDLGYEAAFARVPESSRFTCERIEQDARPTSGGGFLEKLHKPSEPPLRVPIDQIAFLKTCPGCRGADGWTLCARCGAFVCRARSRHGFFTCRQSCGASFQTGPLTEVSAGRHAPRSGPVIGRSAMTALPGSRRKP